jgi:hypothetical protein
MELDATTELAVAGHDDRHDRERWIVTDWDRRPGERADERLRGQALARPPAGGAIARSPIRSSARSASR